MEHTKGVTESIDGNNEIQRAVFEKFRFKRDDIQPFPDGVMALTESGTLKFYAILSDKSKAAPALYEALEVILKESEKGEYKDNAPIAMAQGKAQEALALARRK